MVLCRDDRYTAAELKESGELCGKAYRCIEFGESDIYKDF